MMGVFMFLLDIIGFTFSSLLLCFALSRMIEGESSVEGGCVDFVYI